MTAGYDNYPDRRHEPRNNWTLNWPTLIAIFTLLIAGLVGGITTFNTLDGRVDSNTGDMHRLRTDVDHNSTRIDDLQKDQAASTEKLRAEMLGNFRDINNKLDQLILGQGGDPPPRNKVWKR